MRSKKRLAAFISISITIAFTWLSILPALSRQPEVKVRLQLLDEKGIDAGAMFYTELPCMDDILRRRGVR